MRLAGLITFVAFAAATSPAFAADRSVSVGNGNKFDPAEIQITQGDVVNWNWVGPDTNHSTTTGPMLQTSWDSDPGNPLPNHTIGDRFSREFPDVGEYDYFCKTHAEMVGKIVVVRKETNPNPPPTDDVAPEFGTLSVNLKRRVIRFKLTEAAKVVGKMRGPMRKNLKLSAKAGTNLLKLPKKLKKGRYSVGLTATDAAGNASLVARVKFTIG
jgi:plastocyanin